MAQIANKCPFRHMDQFWVQITERLKAGDWYRINLPKLPAPNNRSDEAKRCTERT